MVKWQPSDISPPKISGLRTEALILETSFMERSRMKVKV